MDIVAQCKGTTNVPLPTSTKGLGLVYSFIQSKRTVTGSGKKYAHVLSSIVNICSFRDLIINILHFSAIPFSCFNTTDNSQLGAPAVDHTEKFFTHAKEGTGEQETKSLVDRGM